MTRERTCPVSRKRMYTSAAAARKGAAHRDFGPVRAYRCPDCKAFHVTSKNPVGADQGDGPNRLRNPDRDPLVALALEHAQPGDAVTIHDADCPSSSVPHAAEELCTCTPLRFVVPHGMAVA